MRTEEIEDDFSSLGQQQQSPLLDEFEEDLSPKYFPKQQPPPESYGMIKKPIQQSPIDSNLNEGYGSNGGRNGGGSSPFKHPYESDDYDSYNSIDSLKANVRGEPGKDYPCLSEVPRTNFKCSQHQHPGYYADVEARCQVFHVCQPDGRHNAFLCPNGTIFSQRHFVCVWWYEFDCQESEKYFHLNADLYENDFKPSQMSPREEFNHGSYGSSRPSHRRPSSKPSSYGYGPTEPSINDHQLYSPKDNYIKNLQSDYSYQGPMTTSSPVYYSSSPKIYGSNRPESKLNSRYEPSHTSYSGSDESGLSDSVTPSPVQQEIYETTPYNLDAALGEEIHSETPLIESLPLTTILPHVEQAVDMAIANRANNRPYYPTKSSNGLDYSPKK